MSITIGKGGLFNQECAQTLRYASALTGWTESFLVQREINKFRKE